MWSRPRTAPFELQFHRRCSGAVANNGSLAAIQRVTTCPAGGTFTAGTDWPVRHVLTSQRDAERPELLPRPANTGPERTPGASPPGPTGRRQRSGEDSQSGAGLYGLGQVAQPLFIRISMSAFVGVSNYEGLGTFVVLFGNVV